MRKRLTVLWGLLAVLLLLPQVCFAAVPVLEVTWVDGMYDVSPFHEGMAVIYSGGKYGYMNANGEIVVPCEYDYAEAFSEGLGLLWRRERRLFVDTSGEVVLRPDYTRVGRFSDGLAPVWEKGKSGYIDKTGAVRIPLTYDSAGEFSEGLACVGKGLKCGYINTENEVVIPFQFKSGRPFSEGLAAVCDESGRYAYIDRAGTAITSFRFDTAMPFHDGVALVSTRDSTYSGILYVTPYAINGYYVRRDGTLFFDYEEAWDFTQGPYLKEVDDPYNGEKGAGYFDRDGNLLAQMPDRLMLYDFPFHDSVYAGPANPFQNGYALLTRDGRCALVDGTLAPVMVLPEEVDRGSVFSEGVAWVWSKPWGRLGIVRLPEALTPLPGVSDWAAADVRQANLSGLLTDRVRSDFAQPVTRLQFAELSVRLMELAGGASIAPASPDRFTDTRDEAALKAAGAGIVMGTGDGSSFAPDAPITREEIAVMLSRTISAVEAQGGGPVPYETGPLAYDDSHEVSPWAVAAMERLGALGIMKGTSARTLSPRQDTSLQEAIILTLRVYQALCP